MNQWGSSRSDQRVYAHTLPPPATEDNWEPLEDHAERVATLAGEFAGVFGARDWARLAGLWHDLGKGSHEFQDYLRKTADPDASEEQSPGRVDHSTFGAQYAARTLNGHAGQLMAFVIAGHHSGLPDATSDEEATRRSTLQARLRKPVPPVAVSPPPEGPGKLRIPIKPRPDRIGFQVAFFTRMLFSALVDADRIATEEFCNEQQAAERARPKPTIAAIKEKFDAFLADLQSKAPRPFRPTCVTASWRSTSGRLPIATGSSATTRSPFSCRTATRARRSTGACSTAAKWTTACSARPSRTSSASTSACIANLRKEGSSAIACERWIRHPCLSR